MPHRFDYRVFALLLDLDDLAGVAGRLRLFGYNRRALLSFHDRDHGPRDGRPLRPWIEARLAESGIDAQGGPIRILCYPRLWGYVFNPLSVYFCHAADGRLAAVVYEVHNTFADAHSYVLPVAADHHAGAPIRQACDKCLHVSPFIPMDARYHFRLSEPAERLALTIRETVAGQDLLVAAVVGRRRPLTDASLLRAVLAHPLMTMKVIAAIHWQALRLWAKGVRVPRRPPPPGHHAGRPADASGHDPGTPTSTLSETRSRGNDVRPFRRPDPAAACGTSPALRRRCTGTEPAAAAGAGRPAAGRRA